MHPKLQYLIFWSFEDESLLLFFPFLISPLILRFIRTLEFVLTPNSLAKGVIKCTNEFPGSVSLGFDAVIAFLFQIYLITSSLLDV